MGFGFGTGGVVFFVVCLFCFVFFFFSVWVLSSVWHWKQVLAATKCIFLGGLLLWWLEIRQSSAAASSSNGDTE